MSDTGLFATRLEDATAKAEKFDDALALLKRAAESEQRKGASAEELRRARETIRKYLTSLAESAERTFISSKGYIRRGSIEILRKLHSNDWEEYIAELKYVNRQLSNSDWHLELKHYQYLEEIANALEAECSEIFQRMRGRGK